jgi:hypothetical protein
VRAAALEEAAKTCDWHAEDANYGPAISTAKKCAAAIRALATKEAAAVEAPSQWISVDERLPEDCEDVLVLCPDTGCEPAIWSAKWLAGSKTFESNSNGWADLEDITHWMPRPAAPSQQSAQGDMGGDHA